MPSVDGWSGAGALVAAWLATYAIHSTLLLAAVALAARFAVRSQAWREVLWKAALVGAVASSLVLTVVSVRPLAGRHGWIAGAAVRQPVPGGPAAPRAGEPEAGGSGGESTPGMVTRRPPSTAAKTAEPSAASPRADPTVRAEPRRDTARGLAAAYRAVGGPSSSPADRAVEPSSALGRAARWPLLLVVLWPAIALWRLGALLVRRRRLARSLADRWPVEGAAAALFAEVAGASGLRRPVRLTTSHACPLPIALSSREVCVPERFFAELTEEEQRGALLHETAHLARRDPDWLLAALLVEAVFWFQPLNALARRRLRETAEYLCDDHAARCGAELGLARCLTAVAAWLPPASLPLLRTANAMADRPSALVRRVERLLAGGRRETAAGRRGVLAALGVVTAVAAIAPAIVPAMVPPPERSPELALLAAAGGSPDPSPGSSPDTGSDVAVRSSGPRELRPASGRPSRADVVLAVDPAAPLASRWRWAVRQGGARRAGGFWVVYAIDRPVGPHQQFLGDSAGISLDEIDWEGTPLRTILGGGPALQRGTIAFLFHLGTATGGDGAVDRIGHRSLSLHFDFAGEPVYWLGPAADAESVPWLDGLLGRVRGPALESEIVEALALHADSSLAVPALVRVLDGRFSDRVRAEAAEGLELHQTAAAMRRARQAAESDRSERVRREAAEALGSIHVPGAVEALVALASGSGDEGMRQEAAEALGDQPEAEAMPAIERVIFHAAEEHPRQEAVEALGEFPRSAAALALLERVIWQHPETRTRREAVETLEDFGVERALPRLRRVLDEHPDERVRGEAIDTLGDLEGGAGRPILLRTARSGSTPWVRREALDRLAHDVGGDGEAADGAGEVAALLEELAFGDPDLSVRLEAVDAMRHLPPPEDARRLRKVIQGHPEERVREAARERLAKLER